MPYNRLHNLKTAFLATSMLTLGTAGVYAQENNAETVTVTGTRVVREGYNAPTPLAVVSTEQIESMAATNIQTFVSTLPAFGLSNGSQENANGGANAGLSVLNLRGLGASRTLVLLDGRRMTFAKEDGQIDISEVPQQLVQRVDVVTGGASAVYGSDAIAGVVNFVLDKTYTGIKGEISGGETDYSDGKNLKIDLTGGFGFDNDRGHVTISTEVIRDDGVRTSGNPNRNWQLRGGQMINNPKYTATNGEPQRLVIDGVGYSQAAIGGIIATGPLQGIAFGQGGQPYTQNNGLISGTYQVGGDWQRNNPRIFEDIRPNEQRENIFARTSYNLTDDIQVYAEAQRVRAKIQGFSQPSAFLGTAGPLIKLDNAYLNPSVKAQMISAGVTQFNLGNLNQADFGILLLSTDRYMSFYEVGAGGVVKAFDTDWTWDTFARLGSSTGFLTDINNIDRPKYLEAADAVVGPTGRVMCRSTLTNPTNGCQPVNLMGIGVSTKTDPGQKYVRNNSWEIVSISETTVGGSVTGNPISIWAGPVSFALSAEYRFDKTYNTADPNSVLANHPFGTFPQTRGSSDVWEMALETVIPITKPDFVLGELDVSAAGRYTSYQLSGEVQTWKLGTTYKPIPDFTFRATASHDIRAPNHAELFQLRAGTTGGTPVNDPFTNTAPTAQMFTQGNSQLKPESANTLGIGGVYQPMWLDGFSLSVDYWEIQLKDIIGSTSGQNELNFCYNGSRPDLCQYVIRNAAGAITGIVSPFINLASRSKQGIDFEASYRTELGFAPGSIALHGNTTINLEDLQTSPGTQKVDAYDVITGAQKLKYTASIRYDLAPVNTTLSLRGHSGGLINSTYIQCASASYPVPGVTNTCPSLTAAQLLLTPTVNLNRKPSAFFLDWSFNYDTMIAGNIASTIFINIKNIENKPQPDPAAYGHQHNTGAWPEYDSDGRVYRIGLRFKM